MAPSIYIVCRDITDRLYEAWDCQYMLDTDTNPASVTAEAILV